MDDLELQIRAAFERSASYVVEPAEALVRRTRRRARRIRLGRAAVAAALVLVVLGGASVAVGDADPHRETNHVATPGPPSSTSTTARNRLETAPGPAATTAPPPATVPATSGVAPAPTTAPPECGPPQVIEPQWPPTMTLLANGDIHFFIGGWPTGRGHETHVFMLDDGTRGEGALERVYTPDEFGPHFVDTHWVLRAYESCPTRILFDVDPESALPAEPVTMSTTAVQEP